MNAIILAGGEGTRLKSVTGDTPKPMALLCGKPILEHILLLLRENGIKKVCISLRYRPEVIMNHFGNGDSLGMQISYNIESQPLGTAGGVKACLSKIDGESFLVISGDCACDFDLRALIDSHKSSSRCLTIAVHPCSSPLRFGTVLADKEGRIVFFAEKPSWQRVVSDLVNTGIYVIDRAAMRHVPENTFFDFAKDLFARLMHEGHELGAQIMRGYWCDIGTARDYHQCNIDAIEGRLSLPDFTKPNEEPSPLAHNAHGLLRKIPCRDRAHLMRLMSQTFMEAGADFSDGIHLNNGTHIFPSATENAINIDVCAQKDAAALEQLAKDLERKTTTS